MRKRRSIVIVASMVACLLGVCVANANAETGDFWQVGAAVLKAGEEQPYEISASGAFVLKGDLPTTPATPLEIKCTSMTLFIAGTGKIIGGKPGTGENPLVLSGCSVAEPEPANCEVPKKEINLISPGSEIVEELAEEGTVKTGKPLLLFSIASFINIAGVKCKFVSCPSMKGSVLAKLTPENKEALAVEVEMSHLLLTYETEGKVKKVALLSVGGEAAELNGKYTTKIFKANPPEFGAFIK